MRGLSLHTFCTKELNFRRNFGYSRLAIWRTAAGGAQPPGLTEKQKLQIWSNKFTAVYRK